MMKLQRMRGWILPLAVALGSAATAGAAQAQAVVTGKVTNEAGAPLVGASVTIKEVSGVGTTTTTTGTYSLTVPASQVGKAITLNARFIGYVQSAVPVTVSGSMTQNFTLKADPFRLEQVVVTGVADATSAKNLTFSVASVTEDQIKAVPASNPIEALAGKVAGAKIALGVGNPGGTPAIRLRGSTNLDVGGSTPLIIVDGVITKNSIADIDAQDIESVEVLKGAAAASFYGSDAANGVINITTKRGKNLAENHLTIGARSEYGSSNIGHWISLAHDHAYQVDGSGNILLDSKGTRVSEADGIADNPYPTSGPMAWRNQLQTWLSDNTYYQSDVQVGLRRGNTNFNSSFSNDHNGGILPFRQGQFKRNARMNVDQGIGSNADMSMSFTYGLQNNDYPTGSSTGFFELLQMPPDIDLAHPDSANGVLYNPLLPTVAEPSARTNPLYGLANESYNLRRERILGSVSGRYRPTSWLRLETSYGTDRLNQQQSTYHRRGYLGETGKPTDGSLNKSTNANTAWNSQTSATATKMFGSLLSTTRAAYQMENSTTDATGARGSRLEVTDVIDLAALDPTQLTVTSGNTVARTTDYMFSQALNLKDRYFVDGLYRRDGSSLFGPDARWSDFYRVSGAYRISEDFHVPGFQELKIRAARGTAGIRPAFDAQYETYSVSQGTIAKAQLGNRNLKPAILTENEYGINGDFLDRFSAEVVVADRTTEGAFLRVPLSRAASGGFSTQVQNAADIKSKSTELSLQMRVIDRPHLGYNVSITGDHTTQSITKMGRAPFRVSADGAQGQNVFYYAEGKSLGIIYGTKFVKSFAELKDNPANASAVESDYVINPLGYLVKKADRGTAAERPIVYVDKNGNANQVLGDVNPDFNFGIANDIRFHSFNIHALFDGQKGGAIYNFSKQWMFQDLRSGDMDQAGKGDDQKITQNFYAAGLYNGLNAADYFVENGTYVKLRELSVGYDLSERLVNKLGMGHLAGAKIAFIGRNLYTWTNYSGFDPDVTSGSDFNFRIDGFKYPNFRTITGQLELRF